MANEMEWTAYLGSEISAAEAIERFRHSRFKSLENWIRRQSSEMFSDHTDNVDWRAVANDLRHDAGRGPGRPPAAGTQRQVRISATVPPEYADWLRAHGDISTQIRAMIEREMAGGPKRA